MARRIFVSIAILVIAISGIATTANAQNAFRCQGEIATEVGTSGDDLLLGTEGRDVIVGLGGNDEIHGLGGNDLICAGNGDDAVYAGQGADTIWAGFGDDVVYSANGSSLADRQDVRGNRVIGGAGDDEIYGSSRWDQLLGGIGNDTLRAYEGRDVILAGAGADIVDGGYGVDNMNAGLGNDTLFLTNGDVGRGSVGVDTCKVRSGSPKLTVACTVDWLQGEPVVETVPVATPLPEETPEPVEEAPTPGIIEVASCNAENETVGIINRGGTAVTLTGWTLHDEDRKHEVNLGDITIQPDQTVVMLSGRDSSSAGARRWTDDNVWNNDGDTAFLVTANGIQHSLRCS